MEAQCFKKGSPKEYSNPIQVQEGAKDDDAVTAFWDDGAEYKITDMSVADYKGLPDKCKHENSSYWTGIHSETNNHLSLKQKLTGSLCWSCTNKRNSGA